MDTWRQSRQHPRTETREKASDGMRPSSEVTPRRVAASEGGVPKRLRLCDNTPPGGLTFSCDIRYIIEFWAAVPLRMTYVNRLS